MRAMKELRKEHDAILRMLKTLDAFTIGMETGRPSEPEDGEEFIDFIRTFVDRCHHAKEEECLFPLLERLGVSRDKGPIGILLEEHRESRALVNSMADALQRYRNGEIGATEMFGQSARSYIDLIRSHVHKENDGLFVIADDIIGNDHKGSLADAFERIEERLGTGTHDELHRLLNRLENKYCGEERDEGDYEIAKRSTTPKERQGESL